MNTQTGSLAIERLAHLTLPVGDLAIAERFYVALLGARCVRRVDHAAFLAQHPQRRADTERTHSPLHLSLSIGEGAELDLFLEQGLGPRVPVPHPHVAFQVESDVLDRFAERLRMAGVPQDGPRRLGPPGQASLYFADPWGNLLELATFAYPTPVPSGPPDFAALAHYDWARGAGRVPSE